MSDTRNDKLASPIGTAIVRENDLNVRSGAGRTFRVIDRLRKGATVEIFQKKGGWFQIDRGRWVAGEYVVAEFFAEKEAAAEPAFSAEIQAKKPVAGSHPTLSENAVEPDFSFEKKTDLPLGILVGTTRLAVRQGPSTGSPTVRILTATDCFEVLENEGIWLRIGENEWVLAAFVQT